LRFMDSGLLPAIAIFAPETPRALFSEALGE
jgi:hypothetical protein